MHCRLNVCGTICCKDEGDVELNNIANWAAVVDCICGNVVGYDIVDFDAIINTDDAINISNIVIYFIDF